MKNLLLRNLLQCRLLSTVFFLQLKQAKFCSLSLLIDLFFWGEWGGGQLTFSHCLPETLFKCDKFTKSTENIPESLFCKIKEEKRRKKKKTYMDKQTYPGDKCIRFCNHIGALVCYIVCAYQCQY